MYCTFIYSYSVQRMDLQSRVTGQQPWSSASSWPARPGFDEGTGPGASSHIACRTSWCKRDCSPDMEKGKRRIMQQIILVWQETVNNLSIDYFLYTLSLD